MTALELEKLFIEAIDATERVHERGAHDACPVCPLADAVRASPRLKSAALAAAIAIIQEDDDAELCVFLATIFHAGERRGFQRAQTAREYASSHRPVA